MEQTLIRINKSWSCIKSSISRCSSCVPRKTSRIHLKMRLRSLWEQNKNWFSRKVCRKTRATRSAALIAKKIKVSHGKIVILAGACRKGKTGTKKRLSKTLQLSSRDFLTPNSAVLSCAKATKRQENQLFSKKMPLVSRSRSETIILTAQFSETKSSRDYKRLWDRPLDKLALSMLAFSVYFL